MCSNGDFSLQSRIYDMNFEKMMLEGNTDKSIKAASNWQRSEQQ
jgi:hypothetical protein